VFLIMTMSSIGLPALNGFIGELLILLGVFPVSKTWTAVAASGIVLGAVYMLWLYQRTMFGRLDNPANASLKDLSLRELATFAPLVVLAFWIGLYPAPFLKRIETSVARVVLRLDAAYAPALAKCLSQPAPAPAGEPGLPAGLIIAAPCKDGSTDVTASGTPKPGAGEKR
jgi:NADH-quinone oxidoreductase subunit M